MDKEVSFIIAKYKERLQSLGIKVQRVVLYGSYAQGKAKEDSDIDLVVISADFKNMDLWERLCLLGRARIGIRKPMEIIGLTEEEYEGEYSGTFISDEVKSKGVEVV